MQFIAIQIFPSQTLNLGFSQASERSHGNSGRCGFIECANHRNHVVERRMTLRFRNMLRSRNGDFGERILALGIERAPLCSQMHEGVEIEYRLKIRGIPIGWRSRITTWDPPHCFVDDQVRGPYRL